MNRPLVTLKLATSLDGRIATGSGQSRWITGEESRAQVHAMRASVDAVMIGIGTAMADDPELTARTEPRPERQPLRVIMDRRARLSAGSRLARSTTEGPVVVLCDNLDGASGLSRAGVEVAPVRPNPGEGEMAAALRLLGETHGVRRLLVEGGGVLAAALIREQLVDRVEWFRAPIVLGAEGRPAIGELNIEWLPQAPKWRRVAVRELGSDLWESYERA